MNMLIKSDGELPFNRGFILLEVMISIALVSSVMIGLFQFEQHLMNTLAHSRYKLRTINHIENYFETLHSRGASVANSQAAVVDFERDIGTTTLTYPDGVQITSELMGVLADGSLKKIKVVGRWQLAGGEAGEISATTMVARYSEFD
jgi:Tfp pilus assembly protein PilV